MASKRRKPSTLKSLKKKMESKVLAVFLDNPSSIFNYKQVSNKLNESDSQIRLIIAESLVNLEKKQKIVETDKGKYKLSAKTSQLHEGRIDISRKGIGYFISDKFERDIKIDSRDLLNSLSGDLVKVKILNQKKRLRAKVVEIVERNKTVFTGKIDLLENFAFLIPNDPNMYVDIYIPLKKLNGAKNGDKAAVEIEDWPITAGKPFGKVIEVLGKPGEHEAEINSFLFEFDLAHNFPEAVLEASEKIPTEITKEDLSYRKDLRDITTFTIDPVDAKDFDDALSIRKVKDGIWEIGVHIADVAHYVKENSIIDREAVKRATSVYLVNKVVSMLPETLSNNLCSLRPNEDKLCFSVLFNIDKKGKVHDYWIGRTAIHSDKRFSYEEAQEVLDKKEGPMLEELLTMNEIANQLRKDRYKRGGFEFGSSEIRFNFDEQGEPIGVKEKKLQDTNRMIEDYMLLANKYVALFVNEIKPTPPFIYRIHDLPDPEKLTILQRFVKRLGYKFNPDPDKAYSEINRLLTTVKDQPEEEMIQQMAVRTMAKAEYSTDNIGHYGLGFEHYSHFTSPIRRYPDVIAHRLLWKYLDKKFKGVDKNEVERLAKHSSKMERKAVEAERASIKYMQAYYIKKFIGQEFDGKVSGVTKWGMYVIMTDNHCEGMVPIRTMTGDTYAFSEEKMAIVGLRSKEEYRLGDQVRVRVVSSDTQSREVNLELVD